jgi:integrase
VASIRKHRDKWQVRFRDPSGTERSESFRLKRDAERAKVRIESALQTGEWIDPTVSKTTTVTAMCDLWWKRNEPNLRPTTRAAYTTAIEKHIKPRLGRYPLAVVKPTMVLDWVSDLEADGVGAHAIKRAYRIVDNVFAMGVRLGMLTANPVPQHKSERPNVPKSKPGVFLEVEEVERLAEAIDPAFKTWVFTVAYTGLRFGEAAGLRVRDVDWLRRTLTVNQQLTEVNGRLMFGAPKTRTGRRTIDVPRFVMSLLEAQAIGKGPEDLLFVGANAAPLRRSNFLSRIWRPAVDKAEITCCTPHALRHSYASWLLAQGTPINEVSAALGHSQPSTTLNIYAHVMPHRRRAAADALDEMRTQIAPVTAIR